jgi:hypothetical protein
MIATMPYTSIRKIINFILPNSKPQPIAVTKSWSLYQDLRLPLEAYILATCKGDLSGLIISGEPTEYALLKAWEAIIEQASKAIGGKALESNLQSVKEYEQLSNREKIGAMLLELSSKSMNPYVLEAMRLFGFPMPKELTADNIQNCQKIFLGWLNKEGIYLDKLHAELEAKQSSNENKPPERADYVRFLLYCSRAFQWPVMSIKDLTTEQYFACVNMYNEYAENMQRQYDEMKNKNKK